MSGVGVHEGLGTRLHISACTDITQVLQGVGVGVHEGLGTRLHISACTDITQVLQGTEREGQREQEGGGGSRRGEEGGGGSRRGEEEGLREKDRGSRRREQEEGGGGRQCGCGTQPLSLPITNCFPTTGTLSSSAPGGFSVDTNCPHGSSRLSRDIYFS